MATKVNPYMDALNQWEQKAGHIPPSVTAANGNPFMDTLDTWEQRRVAPAPVVKLATPAQTKQVSPLAAPPEPWTPTTVADFRMLEAGDRPPRVPLLPGGKISEWKPTLGQRLRGVDNLLKAGVDDSLTAVAAGKVADKLFMPAAPVLGPKLPLADVKPPVEPKGAGLIPYAAGRFIGDLPLLAASYATGGAAGTVGGTAVASRLTPVLGKLPPLGQKIAQGAIKLSSRGFGAGSVYGAGQAAIEGQSAPEAAKTIAQNAALFGIGDPLLSGAGVVVGKGIAKGLQTGKGYVQGLKEPLKLPKLSKLNMTSPKQVLPELLPEPKATGLLSGLQLGNRIKPKPVPKIPLTPLRPAARGDIGDTQVMAGPAPGAPEGGQRVLDTVKRRDIVKHLEKTLNVPVRVGRFKQNALGIFKTKPEVIRTRLANDLSVISHEVGHSLDKQLGLANPTFDGELMALGRQTSRPGYTPEQVRKEGVAEFMRLYLTDEQAARRSVPGYYAAFEEQMQAYPEIHDALLTARKDIHTWYNQPAKARILGSISVGDKQGVRKMSLDSLYTLTFDELHPLKRFVEEAGVKGLPIEQDPYKLAWLARGWSGKAETLLHKGVLDAGGKKIGKSLDEILNPVEKELDDFRAYIVSKHSLEVTARGKHTGITDKDAIEVINNSPARYQQVLDDLVQYQDAAMKQLVDAGVISEQALTKMRSAYSNYVPFYRVFDESPGEIAEWLSQGAFANLRNPVKKMTGSTRDIVDPLESIVKNTYLFTNVAERNRVGRAIVELADQKPGLGRLVEKVEGGRSGRENVLTVYRNGQPEHYQLEPELYRATLALDKESANLAVKLLSYPASWLRAGAVLSPDFMVRNPVRDAFTAFINSKYGFVPVIDTMRGLFHAVKKDDLYWQWMNSGGAHSTLVSLDRDYLQKNLRQVLPGNVRQQLMNNLNPVEWLRSLSELSEQATRLGEFGKGIRKGADPLEAALAARDVTLDFSRLGTHTKGINRIIAFFNASVQGTDKLRRQFMTDPKGAISKTALSVTLPSVLLYFVNRNDPRYQELPQWQKDLFWIIPTKDHLIRIPKPFELGVLFGTVPERALAWMDSKDPKAFDELGKTIIDAAAPGYIPTALMPIIEVWANKSFFTNIPIVPQRESNLEPRLQYGPYTTGAAKGIGGLVNASPRKVETLIRGYTGGLGMYAAKSLDVPLAAIKRNLYGDVPPPKPALALEDRPVIKAFTAKPYASAQSIEDFYTELNRLERQYNSANQGGMLLPAGFNMGRLKQLRQVSRDFSEIRKAVREVQNSKTMTPERKRAEIERLDMLMVNMARQVQGKQVVNK